MQYAQQISARVDDMAVSGPLAPASAPPHAADARQEPIALLRKCGASASHAFVFSPTTKLALSTTEPVAFELAEDRGFFGGGSTKVSLKALSERDREEWAIAIGLLQDTHIPVLY